MCKHVCNNIYIVKLVAKKSKIVLSYFNRVKELNLYFGFYQSIFTIKYLYFNLSTECEFFATSGPCWYFTFSLLITGQIVYVSPEVSGLVASTCSNLLVFWHVARHLIVRTFPLRAGAQHHFFAWKAGEPSAFTFPNNCVFQGC